MTEEQAAVEDAVDALIAQNASNNAATIQAHAEEQQTVREEEQAEATKKQEELGHFIHDESIPVGEEPLRHLPSPRSTETGEEAAVRIQALQRGKATREQMPHRLASAGRRRSVTMGLAALLGEKEEHLKTRPMLRFELMRSEVCSRVTNILTGLAATMTDEERAVLRIQCAQRGRVAHSRISGKRLAKKQEVAAVRIQAVQRGKRARKTCIEKRENWLETQMVGHVMRSPKMKDEAWIRRESIADSLDSFLAMPTRELSSARYSVGVVLGEQVATSCPHAKWITALSVHEGMVFTGGNDNLIYMTDFAAKGGILPNRPMGRCQGHEKEITCVIVIPGEPEHPAHELISSSWDGTVRKWRIPKTPQAGSSQPEDAGLGDGMDPAPAAVGMEVARWCHPAGVTDICVVYSEGLAEGNDIYAACDDGHVCRWSLGAVGRRDWMNHMKMRYREPQPQPQCNALLTPTPTAL